VWKGERATINPFDTGSRSLPAALSEFLNTSVYLRKVAPTYLCVSLAKVRSFRQNKRVLPLAGRERWSYNLAIREEDSNGNVVAMNLKTQRQF
jgi:hypothetical protein